MKFDFKNSETNVDIFQHMTLEEAQEECAIICSNYMTQIFEQLKKHKLTNEEYTVIINSLFEISVYSFKSGYITRDREVQKSIDEFFKIVSELPEKS